MSIRHRISTAERDEEKLRLAGADKDEGSELSAELIEAFVMMYLKKKFDGAVDTPPLHREMWADATSDKKYCAWAAPRAHAKSTAITLAYTMAACLFRQRSFVLIVSDTWGQSVEFLRDIKSELLENEEMRLAFGIKRLLKDSEDDVICQCDDGYRFRIVARGSEQKVRGLKWDHKRPNLIVIDDAENDESVESKLRRDKFMNWFLKALLPCGARECLFRMVGTILHFDSALQRIMKSPTWFSRRYSAHKSMNDFSAILWPEMFSEERLRGIRQVFLDDNKADGYSCEYLNDPIAEGEAYFDPAYFVEMSDQDKRGYGAYYVGWDCAVSTQQKRDFTVATVFKVDSYGHKCLVDVRRGRWDSLQIIEEMFLIQEAYQPAAHFGEKGQIDSAITPFLNQEMAKRQKYLNFVRIARTKDKIVFARPLQAMIKARHVKFDMSMTLWPDVEEEMRRFPKGGHEDIIDAMAIVGQGLGEIMAVSTDEELAEDDWQEQHQGQALGRNLVTGY